MAIYTVRFGLVTSTSGSTVTVYTAPATYTSVLRHMQATTGGSGTTSQHDIHLSSGSVFWYIYATEANESFSWEGRQVIEPGEVLQLTSATEPLTLFATGYQLQ